MFEILWSCCTFLLFRFVFCWPVAPHEPSLAPQHPGLPRPIPLPLTEPGGGSQRPWSLSCFSRADPKRSLALSSQSYFCACKFWLVWMWCFFDVLFSKRSALVEFWNPNPERCQPNNSRSFNCNMQLAEISAMGSAAIGLLVMCAFVDKLLTHHKPDWFYCC